MKIVDLIFTIGFGAITTYIISLAGLFNFWTLYDYSYSDSNPNVIFFIYLFILKRQMLQDVEHFIHVS